MKTKPKRGRRRWYALWAAMFALMIMMPVQSAWAACSNPDGTAGRMIYNSDHNVLQYCNGTLWIGLGGTPMPDEDSLDFTEFKDAMALDASTDIGVSGSFVFSVTNSGTGNSLVVNDQASDTTPFVIDAAGNVAIGAATVAAGAALDVVGTTTTNQVVLKSVTGAAAPGVGASSLRQMMIVQDEKPDGTMGGASVAGTQTRTLNTVNYNSISGASLASNAVTLPAGTYRIQASAPAYSVNRHQIRLYNVTASAPVANAMGTSEYAYGGGGGDGTTSEMDVVVTFAVTTQIRLEHHTATAFATNGLGVDGGTSFGNEVYATMRIEKLQ